MSIKKKISIIIFVLALGGIVGYFSWRSLTGAVNDPAAPKNAIPVETWAAKTETVISKVSAKGKVELINKFEIYPTTQAKIKKVNIKVGDEITEGQILVEYDDESLRSLKNQLDNAKLELKAAQLAQQSVQLPTSELDLTQAQSQINQAKKSIEDVNGQILQIDTTITQLTENLNNAQEKYDSLKILAENGVIPKNDLDNAATTVKQINDQIDNARLQRASAELTAKSAEDALGLATQQYEIIADKQKDPTVQNRINQQQIQVEQVELKIRQLQKQIEDYKTVEVSKVTGNVLTLNAKEGANSSAGVPLLVAAELSNSNLVIKIDVPENNVYQLKLGQEVEIKGDALGKESYRGELTKIYPVAELKQMGNSAETAVTVEVSPRDGENILRPGYSIDAGIITNVAVDTVVVPLMAIVTDESGDNFVFVLNGYTVEKRHVILGDNTGINIQAEGVREGEVIIINPPESLEDGASAKAVTGVVAQ